MEPKSYQYSQFYAVTRLAYFALLFYLVTKPFILKQPMYWTYIKVVLTLIVIYWFCEWLVMVVIPLIKRRPAIELNDKELIYRVKRKVIKWDEVKEVKPASPGGFKPMRVVLKNGKKIKIGTSEIDGGEYEVYQNIVAFFNNSQIGKS